MPTIIDLVDYIIALKQQLQQREQQIQQLQADVDHLNKAKK
jgi:hypothetical protein